MIRPWYAAGYATFILREILAGGMRIALSDLRPRLDFAPAVIELPLRCTSDLEITLMASSITMTPGTITLGIAPGSDTAPATLFVHALYGQDLDGLRAELLDMERRLLLATRGNRETDR